MQCEWGEGEPAVNQRIDVFCAIQKRWVQGRVISQDKQDNLKILYLHRRPRHEEVLPRTSKRIVPVRTKIHEASKRKRGGVTDADAIDLAAQAEVKLNASCMFLMS
jgi:hypothetical protein